jgi:hypothetical protein
MCKLIFPIYIPQGFHTAVSIEQNFENFLKLDVDDTLRLDLNKKNYNLVPKNTDELKLENMDVEDSNVNNEIIQKKTLKFQPVLGISSIYWNF